MLECLLLLKFILKFNNFSLLFENVSSQKIKPFNVQTFYTFQDSYENDTFPELMCDMCQKSFTTPAEWVRHIQNSHSEFELHMSNKKAPSKSKEESSSSTSTATTQQSTGKGKVIRISGKTINVD